MMARQQLQHLTIAESAAKVLKPNHTIWAEQASWGGGFAALVEWGFWKAFCAETVGFHSAQHGSHRQLTVNRCKRLSQ